MLSIRKLFLMHLKESIWFQESELRISLPMENYNFESGDTISLKLVFFVDFFYDLNLLNIYGNLCNLC